MAGSGFGQLILAPVMNEVLEELGLALTLIILSICMALLGVFTLIYRVPMSRVQYDEGSILEEKKENFLSSLLSSFSISFKSPAMVCFFVSKFFFHIGVFPIFAFTFDRATLFGISKRNASHLLSIMGISNCIGAIIFGKLLDVFSNKAFMLTAFVHLLTAFMIIISGYLTSFAGQAVFCAVFGASWGSALVSSILMIKLIMEDNFTGSLGVQYLMSAIASTIGPAVVGQTYDIYESYK